MAGAPLVLPAKRLETLKKKLLPPDFSKKVPNKTKRNAYVAATLIGIPNKPSVVKTLISRKWLVVITPCPKIPLK